MTTKAKLESELAAARAKIDALEAKPQTVVVHVSRTPYERFIAAGGTHKQWVKQRRAVDHQHWHG